MTFWVLIALSWVAVFWIGYAVGYITGGVDA